MIPVCIDLLKMEFYILLQNWYWDCFICLPYLCLSWVATMNHRNDGWNKMCIQKYLSWIRRIHPKDTLRIWLVLENFSSESRKSKMGLEKCYGPFLFVLSKQCYFFFALPSKKTFKNKYTYHYKTGFRHVFTVERTVKTSCGSFSVKGINLVSKARSR